MRTELLTAAALLGFAANSLLCRAALQDGLVDAATFTSVRLWSGAAMLAALQRALRPRLFTAVALAVSPRPVALPAPRG